MVTFLRAFLLRHCRTHTDTSVTLSEAIALRRVALFGVVKDASVVRAHEAAARRVHQRVRIPVTGALASL